MKTQATTGIDHPPQNISNLLKTLTQLAYDHGASAAAVIRCQSIPVKDHLADLCKPPGCPNYGLAASCPPHVGGPQRFREQLTRFEHAIVFKIDVRAADLMGAARPDIFRTLHRIAATIEQAAVARGCKDACAFAGGSCKELFCTDHPSCRVVQENGPCRYPAEARPSMSGYGIDVFGLMAALGWPQHRIGDNNHSDDGPTGSIAGMVLIC
ncbi:hypothetical protein DSCO28_66560 [Desulfosarcina ovata subsp. sediminis]|uniref:Metal-binding protein n=1 Tax=Desulfosarcina ovata subsp. sediminis TaxID=885957 RepID=A0A5K8A194_9BACT|nr:DUF2284 domain-containing protein [Desulfosarcina ovata]BBO86090.1 hypothetical protein DSCO28_66560 [Desulfosarcina ovata subsp. sediminis]